MKSNASIASSGQSDGRLTDRPISIRAICGYGQQLREAIAETVVEAGDVEDELRYLMETLAR